MPAYNRLISRQDRLTQPNNIALESRKSGKTTAAILYALAQAIVRPGTPIPVDDPDATTGPRRQDVRHDLHQIARKLGLRYIETANERDSLTVRSNHFTDNPWEIE